MLATSSTSAIPKQPKQKIGKRKAPRIASVPTDARLLVGRQTAAEMVSLSIRSIDYMLASKQLPFRKIRGRTLIPVSALQRLARIDRSGGIAS